MSRQSVADSKARLESEIRAIAAAHKGQPVEEVAAIIRRRTNAAVDLGFLADLLKR